MNSNQTDRSGYIRVIFFDDEFVDVPITSVVSSYSGHYVPGNFGINSIKNIVINTPLKTSGSSTLQVYDIRIHVNVSTNPDAPIHGGSMSGFDVIVKTDGSGNAGLFYEDIVNSVYLTAIENNVFSYAQYPYTTLFCCSEGNKFVYFLFVSDIPIVKDLGIHKDKGLFVFESGYAMGASGVVFIGVPDYFDLGNVVSFVAMQSYSYFGMEAVLNSIIQASVGSPHLIPMPDGSDFNYNSVADKIMSFEGDVVSLYGACTNYVVSKNDTTANRYYDRIKSSFKFSESWAALLRIATDYDTNAILDEILASLRSTDMSTTVYERIDQIYTLMTDMSQLSVDDPIQSQLDKSVDALNNWADTMDEPDVSEVLLVTSTVSAGIDGIMSALGVIGLLGMMGIVLGVIKLVLQR